MQSSKTSESGCWNWTKYRNEQGYGRVWLNGKLESAHRVAYTLFTGPIPEGIKVLHTCDNPQCINPAHLRLGTQQDNMIDATRKNRMRHKLSPADVLDIRRLRAEGMTYPKISALYSVSENHIGLIARKLERIHVP